MFKPARRWRLLAALALLPALVQGRAWGEETLWTKAANLTCRIGNLPRTLIRKPRPAVQPAGPIFAWEKKDAAEWGFAAGSFLEAIGDYERAYLCYRALSLRHPARQDFATAAARARATYPDAVGLPDDYASRWCVMRIDDRFNWLMPVAPKSPCATNSALLPCCDAEHGDGPITDEFLDATEPDAWTQCYSQWCAMSPFDSGLSRRLAPKERLFSMFSCPAAEDASAPLLPERKDMLPDTEDSRLLIDLGVIAKPYEILGLPPPWTQTPSERRSTTRTGLMY